MDGRKKGHHPKIRKILKNSNSQGPDDKLKDNPNDRNLFPGDRLIHYEYLFGQSNNHTSNYYPTLQVII